MRQRPSRFTAKIAVSPPISCNSAQYALTSQILGDNLRFTAKVAVSPPISCNSAQYALTSQILGDNLCRANPPFGIVSFHFKCLAMVASWHPTGAPLAEGWSGMLSCNPAQDFPPGGSPMLSTVPSYEPGVGRNIALHAASADGTDFHLHGFCPPDPFNSSPPPPPPPCTSSLRS